ncbi:transient receptor potential cation channel subfamily A member 1-like isoform X2 [Paramacrobiotus metropolitanus]|uniref:transient receptor potential cation channel subfamily A member 1-like isoform X2 n=1 Tax=Paramacrobiotus metropolitanus TaxID=2943436 RepID=UPI002445C605|nr:transient receptor potential cation channel subfamily A member 1-like isoform X2 [Paramacrobiotus metropolitanus]
MFERLREALGLKRHRSRDQDKERNASARDRGQSRHLLEDGVGGSPRRRMSPANGLNAANLAGLTGLSDFNQLLSSFVIDTSLGPKQGRENEKPIHYAVRTDNFALLESLLSNSKWRWDPESVADSCKGERPIHVAAEFDNLSAFKFLRQHHADLHSKQTDFHWLQAVHIAAATGSYNVLRYLLVDVIATDNKKFVTAEDYEGGTALHWAVLGHHMDCIQLLLERGASVDHQQSRGPQCTPLHYACLQRSLEMVSIMAELRPEEFRRALSIKDSEGSTPLHRAVALDDPALVEYLLDKGAPTDMLDAEGRSPVIMAAVREAWYAAAVMLKYGVNPFICDPVFQRTTAHHAAMVGANPLDCPELIERMNSHPEWKKRLDALDSFGYTALQYAAGYGHVATFNGLLQIGASIDSKNHKNKTVLHYAAKYGQLEMVRTLLGYPIGPRILNAMDHRGRGALHMAAAYGHQQVVELLLSKGAFAFRDDSGRTAFHLAAARNHYQIMESIAVYFGAVLNDADKYGNTALHLAAANNAAEAVTSLLNSLTNAAMVVQAVTREEASGYTPVDLAIRNKNERAALAFINSKHWKLIVMQHSFTYGTVVLGLIAHLPNVMKRCLDRSMSEAKFDEHGSYTEYDFTILHHCTNAEKSKGPYNSVAVPMRALKLMATMRRSDLLAHPVCTTLLERKWISYGMYCSGIIMASNLVFVSVLSYVMMSAVESDLRPHLLAKSRANVAFCHPNGSEALSGPAFAHFHEEILSAKDYSFKDTPALLTLGVALIIIFLKELAELRSEGLRYFMQWMNYMEILLFITCGGFVFCFYQDYRAGAVGRYTYQFGTVAIFLAWFNLLRFFRPFGTFGIYSFMFFTILKTLIQVSGFFFLLTAAFTGAFSTLFQTKIYPNSTTYYAKHDDPLDPDDLRTSHENVVISGLRIGAMTIGDLESLDNFLYPLMDGMIAYPELAFLFYAVFLVLMPILLNNLLTGLAIGDMEAIRSNAVTLRLEMQVFLHESLERVFPTFLIHRIHRATEVYKLYTHRPIPFKHRVAKFLQSGGMAEPNVPHIQPQTRESEVEDVPLMARDETSNLYKRLRQLDDTVAEQREMLSRILKQMERDSAEQEDPSFIAKMRKRSERAEEDRKHAERMHITDRKVSFRRHDPFDQDD